jgi:hypothetical protein
VGVPKHHDHGQSERGIRGAATAVGSLVTVATVTIRTIVGLTLASAKSGYEIRGQRLWRARRR